MGRLSDLRFAVRTRSQDRYQDYATASRGIDAQLSAAQTGPPRIDDFELRQIIASRQAVDDHRQEIFPPRDRFDAAREEALEMLGGHEGPPDRGRVAPTSIPNPYSEIVRVGYSARPELVDPVAFLGVGRNGDIPLLRWPEGVGRLGSERDWTDEEVAWRNQWRALTNTYEAWRRARSELYDQLLREAGDLAGIAACDALTRFARDRRRLLDDLRGEAAAVRRRVRERETELQVDYAQEMERLRSLEKEFDPSSLPAHLQRRDANNRIVVPDLPHGKDPLIREEIERASAEYRALMAQLGDTLQDAYAELAGRLLQYEQEYEWPTIGPTAADLGLADLVEDIQTLDTQMRAIYDEEAPALIVELEDLIAARQRESTHVEY